ncbi:MAG: exo-alpha-sialidase [Flavobacteriales bacterium]|nr:exo-alpha-sialidase [Flavobacteriales bacterium]MCB9446859.1 exo-alpha-sialidase [Flavobacteriales bacterium]
MKYALTFLSCTLLFASCQNTQVNPEDVPTNPESVAVDSYPSSCPFLTRDPKGRPVLSWVRHLTDTTAVMCFAISDDEDDAFGSPVVVTPSTDVHPHGENLPKIIFRPDGSIIAMWGKANPSPANKYWGLVSYAQSWDKGKTWTEAKPLVQDTTSQDQRYFDMALLPNGEVATIWLDNREEVKAEGSSLYYAVTDGRKGFANEKPIGASVCPCCRTDLYIDPQHNIHVAYRDIIQDSIRDMVHAVSTDNGATFSEAKRISPDNWILNGCPHTGPSMVATGDVLHFAWYTGGDPAGVFYAHSEDGGETFSVRDSVSGVASSKHPQIAAFDNGNLIIVWDEVAKQGEHFVPRIGLQFRNPHGNVLYTEHITEDGPVAFPVLLPRTNQTFVLAYTYGTPGSEKVKYTVRMYPKW